MNYIKITTCDTTSLEKAKLEIPDRSLLWNQDTNDLYIKRFDTLILLGGKQKIDSESITILDQNNNLIVSSIKGQNPVDKDITQISLKEKVKFNELQLFSQGSITNNLPKYFSYKEIYNIEPSKVLILFEIKDQLPSIFGDLYIKDSNNGGDNVYLTGISYTYTGDTNQAAKMEKSIPVTPIIFTYNLKKYFGLRFDRSGSINNLLFSGYISNSDSELELTLTDLSDISSIVTVLKISNDGQSGTNSINIINSGFWSEDSELYQYNDINTGALTNYTTSKGEFFVGNDPTLSNSLSKYIKYYKDSLNIKGDIVTSSLLKADKLSSINDSLTITNASDEELESKGYFPGNKVNSSEYSVFHFDNYQKNGGSIESDSGPTSTNLIVSETTSSSSENSESIISINNPIIYDGSKVLYGNSILFFQSLSGNPNNSTTSFYFCLDNNALSQQNVVLYRLHGTDATIRVILNYNSINNQIVLEKETTSSGQKEYSIINNGGQIKPDEWNLLTLTSSFTSFSAYLNTNYSTSINVSNELMSFMNFTLIGAFIENGVEISDIANYTSFNIGLKELLLSKNYISFEEHKNVYNNRYKYSSLSINDPNFIFYVKDLSSFYTNIFETANFSSNLNLQTVESSSFRNTLSDKFFEVEEPQKTFLQNLIDTIYPVGCTYTQYPNDSGIFLQSEEPANLWPGTSWKEMFNTEGVFFRTAGGSSEDGRSNGIQLDEVKKHNHSISHTHEISSSGSHTHTVTANRSSHTHQIYATKNMVVGDKQLGTCNYSRNDNKINYTQKERTDGLEGHTHTIKVDDTKSSHTHTTNGPSTTTSGSAGGTETRPKNRLIKIWKRQS